MIEKRRATAYQLPPLPSPNAAAGAVDKKNRRRSTSEINRRRPIDVEVRPIMDDATLLAGKCGRLTTVDGELQFVLTPEHTALEKRLLKEYSSVIASNRGPDIQSILSIKPRSKMILDLEAPVRLFVNSPSNFLDLNYQPYRHWL